MSGINPNYKGCVFCGQEECDCPYTGKELPDPCHAEHPDDFIFCALPLGHDGPHDWDKKTLETKAKV